MIERRQIDLGEIQDQEIQTRADKTEDGKRFIMGYAAIIGSPSKQITERINGNVKTFTETISKEAFSDADLRAVAHLVDHSYDKMVGRTGANTTVQLTERGLFFKTSIPPEGKATTAQEDLYRNSEQGIVKGASFAFAVANGGDSWKQDANGNLHRSINKISRIVDVTSTFNGAYDAAFTFTRSLDESQIEVEKAPEVQTETKEPELPTFDADTLNLDFQMSILKGKTF